MKRNFMGFDGFTWFQGVVEDHNDPEQIGRVKVRCLGIHTEDKETLPTEDLPWAMVMMLLLCFTFTDWTITFRTSQRFVGYGLVQRW